jgi:hypothetical protein
MNTVTTTLSRAAASVAINYTPPPALTNMAIAARTALTPYAVPLLATATIAAVQLSAFFALTSLSERDVVAIRQERGWLSQRHLIMAAIICAYASLHFSFTHPGLFSFPVYTLPYLRLLYSYSLLILTKTLIAPPASAVHFHRDMPLKLLTSALFTFTIHKVGFGSPYLKVATAFCALPIIVEIDHWINPASKNACTFKMDLHNNSVSHCMFPLALGVATRSLPHLVMAMVYVYGITRLQASPILMPGLCLHRPETDNDGWKIKLLPEMDEKELGANETLKWLLNLSQKNVVAMPGYHLYKTGTSDEDWSITVTSISKLCHPYMFSGLHSVMRELSIAHVSVSPDLKLCRSTTDSNSWTLEIREGSNWENLDIISTLQSLIRVIPQLILSCKTIDSTDILNAAVKIPGVKVAIGSDIQFYKSDDSRFIVAITHIDDVAHWYEMLDNLPLLPYIIPNSDALITPKYHFIKTDNVKNKWVIKCQPKVFHRDMQVILDIVYKILTGPEKARVTFLRGLQLSKDKLDTWTIKVMDNVDVLNPTVSIILNTVWKKKLSKLTIDMPAMSITIPATGGLITNRCDIDHTDMIRTLKCLMNISNIASFTFTDLTIPLGRIQKLPDTKLLPKEWGPLLIKGEMSFLPIGNGIYVFDQPGQPRVAIFDPSSKQDLSRETINQILMAYCHSSIADITAGADIPPTDADWIPLLNNYFATHPSTDRSKAICESTCQLQQELRMHKLDQSVTFYFYSNYTGDTILRIVGSSMKQFMEKKVILPILPFMSQMVFDDGQSMEMYILGQDGNYHLFSSSPSTPEEQ